MSVRAVPGPVRATSAKPPSSERGYLPEEMRSRKGSVERDPQVTATTRALADRIAGAHFTLEKLPPATLGSKNVVVYRSPHVSSVSVVATPGLHGIGGVRVELHSNKDSAAIGKKKYAPPSRDIEPLKEKALELDPENAIKDVYAPEFAKCLRYSYWLTAKKILELVLSIGLPRDTYKPFAHMVDRMPRVPAYVGLSASLSHVPRPSQAAALTRIFVEI